MGHANSKDDAARFRAGYPGQEEDEDEDDDLNEKFQKNKISSVPDGDLIENIHKEWFGKYDRLEVHHGYIQWLFPIREHGMNSESQMLTLREARAITADADATKRVLTSFKLMLDFYGMSLDESGNFSRSADWRHRYSNLVNNPHNFLRITRILKCLQELGHAHVAPAWCEFILSEVFESKALQRCEESCVNYWVPVIRDDAARCKLVERIEAQRYGRDEGRKDRSGTGRQNHKRVRAETAETATSADGDIAELETAAVQMSDVDTARTVAVDIAKTADVDTAGADGDSKPATTSNGIGDVH